MSIRRPRLMIAAPASGSGKTTVTVGLLQALTQRDIRASAFKCGPDYIDPLFHRSVLGLPGCNLDLFFTPPDIVRCRFEHYSRGTGIAIIEGVMGYYDGVGMTDRASSWRVAVETGTPVVLVVNPKGGALSVAAMLRGLRDFRSQSQLGGIILNNCSEKLFSRLGPALERETELRVFGYLPPLPQAGFDSRHLGLVPPDGIADIRSRLGVIAEQLEKTVAVDDLLALSCSAGDGEAALPEVVSVSSGKTVRIAVARDAAFCFYYQENLDLLRSYGAEIVFFSPLTDSALPDSVGGLYIGGGYPELHARELSLNVSMRHSIASAIASGLPTLAECGGFMYLQTTLETPDGAKHDMVDAIPGNCRNTGKLNRFGYIGLKSREDNVLLPKNDEIKGHEFHYWDSDHNGDAFTATKASGPESWGCFVQQGNLLAGFPHLYFWSNRSVAENLVNAAVRRSP